MHISYQWCKILIITKISHILVNFNDHVLTEGRSSRPLVDIVPEELLQESQWVSWSPKSIVSIVGNDREVHYLDG